MSRGVPLRREQVEDIVRLFEAGVAVEEIAAIHQVCTRAVQYRLARRGLRARRQPIAAVRLAIDTRRAQIHLLRGRGRSIGQMATELRLHPARLRLWMRQHMADLYAQMRTERRKRPRKETSKRPVRSPARASAPVRRRGPLQATRVCRDYELGYSIAAIARHYRAHPWSVWRVLRRKGVSLRSRTRRSPMWLAAMRARRERRRTP